MVTGRPRSFTVKLSEEEHEVLNSYARSRSLPQRWHGAQRSS